MANVNLKIISTEDLEKELERRKAKTPTPLKTPDYTNLETLCSEFMDKVRSDPYIASSMEHYIFEAAIAAYYGKEAWGWINYNMGG
jgi:hypothetical protein